MLRKIVLALFVINVLSFNVYSKNSDIDAKIVNEIRVQGNINVKVSFIKDNMKIKRKKVYSQKLVDDSIKSLLDTGLFDDVTIESIDEESGLVLLVQVKEKPKIVAIDFQGNEQMKKSKIKAVIKTELKKEYDQAKVNIDEEAIATLYKDKGYADVKVDSYVDSDDKTGEAVLTFYITEGKKIMIKKVLVTGNTAIKTKKILKTMKTKRKKVFKEEVLTEDLKQIEHMYKNEGYLQVEVKDTTRELDEARQYMTLTINVSEGKQYIVGDIKFEGNTEFSNDKLIKTVSLQKGKIYRQENFDETIATMQDMYAEKGYIQARVVPKYEYKENIVDIIFDITENSIVYIDRIYLDGNKVTRDYVIRRQILVKEGEPFNVKRIRRSQEQIYNLGFFQDVQIDLDQTAKDKADLIFNVVEQKTGLASVGVGYSSQDKAVGNLQVSENNLFGRGQSISLLWEFGKTKKNYQISFNEPYFFGTYTSFGCDVFNMTRDLEYVYTNKLGSLTSDWYTEKHLGGNIRFGRKLREDYYAKATYGFDRVRISDVDTLDDSPEHQLLINEQGKGYQDTSSLTLAVSRDTRDNVFYTYRGMYTNLSAKFAGGLFGGNNNFSKFYYTNSIFIKTFWKFVLAFNMEGGVVAYYSPSTEVPIYERFYVGGAESVRGYNYRGDIGPSEGGNYKMVYNIEYKFPIVSENKRPILQWAFFADAGGSWLKSDEVTFKIGRESNYMKAGVGFGLRFTTPVFPVRLDWGYGLNQREGEDPKQFYFTVGQLF
jgi:outer membrane protein insertion porin family